MVWCSKKRSRSESRLNGVDGAVTMGGGALCTLARGEGDGVA